MEAVIDNISDGIILFSTSPIIGKTVRINLEENLTRWLK